MKRYQTKVKDLKDNREVTDLKSDQFLKSRSPIQYQSPRKVQSPSSPGMQSYPGHFYNSEKRLKFNNYEDLYL